MIFLAQFSRPLHEDLTYEEIYPVETKDWCIAFDDSSTLRGCGEGVILYDLEGTNVFLSFKLEFPCFTNGAGYETRIIGLFSALMKLDTRLLL